MTAANSPHDTVSRPIEISTIAEGGADYVIEPSENERAAIARRLGIPAITKLRGQFHLERRRGGVDAQLTINAETERTCVASLEPMTETIRETILMQFRRDLEETEADDAIDNEVLLEPLDGDEIDLGELLVQHLALSLDPYPRFEDAQSLAEKYRGAASPSPFSTLKGLVERDS